MPSDELKMNQFSGVDGDSERLKGRADTLVVLSALPVLSAVIVVQTAPERMWRLITRPVMSFQVAIWMQCVIIIIVVVVVIIVYLIIRLTNTPQWNLPIDSMLSV